MWQGSKWQVFDGESDEVLCTVKEDKLDLKVFRAFNSQVQNQPDYKTKTNNMSLCMPWSLVILHGKEPLAEVCVQKTLCPSNSLFCNTRGKMVMLNLGHKTKLVAKAHSYIHIRIGSQIFDNHGYISVPIILIF
jgi:hypothetical protein